LSARKQAIEIRARPHCETPNGFNVEIGDGIGGDLKAPKNGG
jgi:hypothetical protein